MLLSFLNSLVVITQNQNEETTNSMQWNSGFNSDLN